MRQPASSNKAADLQTRQSMIPTGVESLMTNLNKSNFNFDMENLNISNNNNKKLELLLWFSASYYCIVIDVFFHCRLIVLFGSRIAQLIAHTIGY